MFYVRTTERLSQLFKDALQNGVTRFVVEHQGFAYSEWREPTQGRSRRDQQLV